MKMARKGQITEFSYSDFQPELVIPALYAKFGLNNNFTPEEVRLQINRCTKNKRMHLSRNSAFFTTLLEIFIKDNKKYLKRVGKDQLILISSPIKAAEKKETPIVEDEESVKEEKAVTTIVEEEPAESPAPTKVEPKVVGGITNTNQLPLQSLKLAYAALYIVRHRGSSGARIKALDFWNLWENKLGFQKEYEGSAVLQIVNGVMQNFLDKEATLRFMDDRRMKAKVLKFESSHEFIKDIIDSIESLLEIDELKDVRTKLVADPVVLDNYVSPSKAETIIPTAIFQKEEVPFEIPVAVFKNDIELRFKVVVSDTTFVEVLSKDIYRDITWKCLEASSITGMRLVSLSAVVNESEILKSDLIKFLKGLQPGVEGIQPDSADLEKLSLLVKNAQK